MYEGIFLIWFTDTIPTRGSLIQSLHAVRVYKSLPINYRY